MRAMLHVSNAIASGINRTAAAAVEEVTTVTRVTRYAALLSVTPVPKTKVPQTP